MLRDGVSDCGIDGEADSEFGCSVRLPTRDGVRMGVGETAWSLSVSLGDEVGTMFTVVRGTVSVAALSDGEGALRETETDPVSVRPVITKRPAYWA